MEDVIFALRIGENRPNTSSRFANVAFSNGSLLAAFLQRLARRQPLAAPRGTSRYFVTQEEAAEICLLRHWQSGNGSCPDPPDSRSQFA